MTGNPLLSILIPAYNHEDYIADAIRSVWSQNMNNCEIVVIDDGSSDATYKTAKELSAYSPIKMQVITRKNKGLIKTLNELISVAEGDYLLFLASDDKLGADGVSEAVEALASSRELAIVYTNGLYWFGGDIFGKRLYDHSMTSILNGGRARVLAYLYSNVSTLLIQTTVVRRTFLEKIGCFDEESLLDDWPFQINVFRNLESDYQYRYLDVDMTHYRRHGHNISRDIKKQYAQITDTVNRHVPAEFRKENLANAYHNLAIFALLKSPALGVKLLKESQRYKFCLKRLMSLPFLLSSIVLRYLVNKIRDFSRSL